MFWSHGRWGLVSQKLKSWSEQSYIFYVNVSMFMWLLLYNSHSLRRKQNSPSFSPCFYCKKLWLFLFWSILYTLIRRNVNDLDVWCETGCNAQRRQYKEEVSQWLSSQSSLGGGRLRPACLWPVASEMGYSALWDVLICTNEITSGLNLQRYRTQIKKPWKVPETLRDFLLNSSSFFKDLDVLLHLLWVVVVVEVQGVVFMPREIF